MTKKTEPYFTPVEEINDDGLNSTAMKTDQFFTPLDDDSPLSVPDTIDAETTVESPDEYQFVQRDFPKRKTVRRLFFVAAGLFTIILGWQSYSIMMELFSVSTLLGSIFGVLLLVLLELIAKEGYQFRKGQLQFAKIEQLRDQADMFVKERSHGKSSAFINDLTELYNHKPQQPYLTKAIEDMPDYLNDEEVVTSLSDNYFTQLDKEALRVIKQESLATAGMVAVSQVAVIDSLVVTWKTLKMVNQINNIYGISLTRLGQWKLFVRLVKATVFSAGSQKAINITASMTDAIPGVKAVGSLVQGLGIGIYVARIGVEAMKHNRPIAFKEDEVQKINLISDGIKLGLGIDKREDEHDR